MICEAWLHAYEAVTGQSVQITGRTDPPDYETLIDGRPVSVELTEIYKAPDAWDMLALARSQADVKARKSEARGLASV